MSVGIRLPRLPDIRQNAKTLGKYVGKAYKKANGDPNRTVMINGRPSKLNTLEVPWGPGGALKWANALAELKRGGQISEALGNTGATLRSINMKNYVGKMPFIKHDGHERTVSEIVKSLYLDPTERGHLLQLVKNDKAHLPDGKIQLEDLLGSFATTTNAGDGTGVLSMAHILQGMRGKGINTTVAQARNAQGISHLGHNPTFMSSLSGDSARALLGPLAKGYIKGDPMMYMQMLEKRAATLSKAGNKAGAKHLWDLSDALKNVGQPIGHDGRILPVHGALRDQLVQAIRKH